MRRQILHAVSAFPLRTRCPDAEVDVVVSRQADRLTSVLRAMAPQAIVEVCEIFHGVLARRIKCACLNCARINCAHDAFAYDTVKCTAA